MFRRTAARSPAFSAVPLDVGDALDESHELGAGLGIGLKDAQHTAGENPTVLLFDPAHLHAEVIGLDHDGDADRLEVFLEALGDLTRPPLLHLQASAVALHRARHLAGTDQPAAW